MKNIESLTDKQLKQLLKIRLINDISDIIPTRIKVESKTMYIDDISNKTEYVVSYLVSSKKYATSLETIKFTKFYPNEFLFLQKCGIDLKN